MLTPEKIIDFVLESRPAYFTVRRKAFMQELLYWRKFRQDVLKLYGIPFKDYCARVRYYQEVFGD